MEKEFDFHTQTNQLEEDVGYAEEDEDPRQGDSFEEEQGYQQEGPW